MSLKKFLAPNIAILLLLSFVWLTGFDRIYLETDHQLNLSKYMQVQQHIVNNYVGETDINELYKQSILGLVRALDGDDEEDENRSEEHTSELQSRGHLVCRLLREKKNTLKLFKAVKTKITTIHKNN